MSDLDAARLRVMIRCIDNLLAPLCNNGLDAGPSGVGMLMAQLRSEVSAISERVSHGGQRTSTDSGRNAANRCAGTESRVVSNARALIEDHHCEHLTTSTVARAVGCSRCHLATRFRLETGYTIRGYLSVLRATTAIAMVLRGDKVESIALSVGYRSKKNFYRVCRQVTGTTPGEFRQAKRW